MKRGLVVTTLVMFLVAGSAFAANITIWDEDSGGTNPWHTRHNEDQEVEPSCLIGQGWDTEAFLWNSTTSLLSLVAGFDLQFGSGPDGNTYPSGDIFIDTTGDIRFGESVHAPPAHAGGQQPNSLFNYDFVLDINWANLTYNLYGLTPNSQVMAVALANNRPGSSPVTFVHTFETAIQANVGFAYTTGLADFAGLQGDVEVGGPSHNQADFILPWLPEDPGFVVHYTYWCGNDAILGSTNDDYPPDIPEPTTVALLGLGLAGVLLRKRFWA